MTRTTFSLEEKLLKKLHRIADRRGVSLATVIRESLEKAAQEDSARPKSRSLGAYASGRTDSVKDLGRELGEPRTWR